MGANANTLNLTISVDDKGSLHVKQFSGVVESSAKQAEASSQRLGDRFEGAAKRIQASYGLIAGAVTAALGSQVFGLINQAVKAASDLEEMTSKFNVVFAGQEEIAARSTAMLVQHYGASTREAREYLSSIQDLLVPMGMQADLSARLSTEIVKLSADLGSFNNLPTAQVMADIQSALVGNYETMKKYGVVMGEEIVQRQALNLGLAKTKDGLNAGHKAYAAFTIMVNDSKAAIGDKVRTMDSYANQLKSYHAALEDAGASLGKAFLPVATAIVAKLQELARAWQAVLNPGSINKAQIERMLDQKLLSDLKTAEQAFDYYEKGYQADRDERMAALRREIQLIKDKIALRKAAADADKGGAGQINVPTAAPGDFTDKYGGAGKSEAAARQAEATIKKFYDDYARLTMTAHEFEQRQLDLLYREYAQHVKDKAALDAWYFEEKRRLELKEFAAGAGYDGDYITPESRYARSYASSAENLRKYQELIEAQKTAMHQADELANNERWWQTYVEGIEDATRANEIFNDTMNTMSQHASDAFANFVTGTVGAKEAFLSMVNSMISALIRLASQKGFEMLFGMIMNSVGGLFGGGTTPTGIPSGSTYQYGPGTGGWGMLSGASEGAAPGRGRAGRSGDGAGGSERSAGKGGGDTYIFYQISALDTQSFSDALRRSGAVQEIVSDDLKNNWGLRGEIMGSF